MSAVWKAVTLEPGLYFVATPIGNARDVTLRALDVLASADVLAAEDTRRLRQLMEMHGVPLNGRRVLAYHDHNGAAARPKLLAALAAGQSVAYASDAGSPLVADPGFALGRAAQDAESPVFAIPGPAAVIAGLTVSGLPSDRFTFAGFPPQAAGAKRRFLDEFSDTSGSLVLYESPKRISDTLRVAVELFGAERPAALARELTKKFEDVRRGTLSELLESAESDPPRGEIVLIIGGGTRKASPEDIDAALKEALASSRLKDAARDVADRFGVSRRDLYQRGLELQNSEED
ncbi:MAG: 16S rRNA (cytidine(1402)-2'-O)-methyltransferase [Paracoccaceae bacterium]